MIAQLRIGQNGLRPFGSSLAQVKIRNQSMGARIRSTKPEEPCKKIPLQGVYHRLKVWLQSQYDHGQEPRLRSICCRCELELAQEIGVQRALQRVHPSAYQEYVLNAAKHRLQSLQQGRGSKKIQKWLNQTLMPSIGGRLRHGQKLSLQTNPPSELKCRLQWAQMDYMTWLVVQG